MIERLDWNPILERAARIAASYSTPVTLRQLFYRLVAAGLLPNTQPAYKTLSVKTAEARRHGWFPRLLDRGRAIHRFRSFAGDQHPSGEDIDRDFLLRTGCFAQVERVTLTAEQVDAYRLPPQPGKQTDSRVAGFVARHGRLVQVELDALAPDDLQALYQAAIDRYWDASAYAAALAREAQERERL
jgi:hypothetical protein